MLYAHTFRKVKVVLSSGNVHRNIVFCPVALLIQASIVYVLISKHKIQ